MAATPPAHIKIQAVLEEPPACLQAILDIIHAQGTGSNPLNPPDEEGPGPVQPPDEEGHGPVQLPVRMRPIQGMMMATLGWVEGPLGAPVEQTSIGSTNIEGPILKEFLRLLAVAWRNAEFVSVTIVAKDAAEASV